MKEEKLHAHPYNGTNNRKKTKGRIISDKQIQSIPIYDRKLPEYVNGEMKPRKLLGYRYVQQYVSTR
jgi:hypothetical protein